jgi:hypothetical protein
MSGGDVFVAVAAKTLSAVEVDPRSSHQHELAAGTLRRMLIDHGQMAPDAERVVVPVGLLRLDDDEESERIEDHLTVYDARRQNPDRGPEWRAYYAYGSEAERLVRTMDEGDQMVYAIDRAGAVHVLLIAASSHWSEVLRETFAFEASPRLTPVPAFELEQAQRRSPVELIADALEINPVDADDHDWLIAHFGGQLPTVFPDTQTMAALAHARVGLDAQAEDADTLLERWLTAETDLFMLLERAEGEYRIAQCRDFEDYVATVLSILQRRKARRGRSLEIHLETLFTARELPYERQVQTEPGSNSDFILPGLDAYRAIGSSAGVEAGVLHLGAKSTARERWKQVLSEATKLRRRHLATLDPQLSHASLHAMAELNVVPVMPARLGALYEGHGITTVEGFIAQARWVMGSTQ